MLSPSLFVLTLRNPSLAVIELSLWADKKIELPNHFTSLPLPERKGVRVPNTLQVGKEKITSFCLEGSMMQMVHD